MSRRDAYDDAQRELDEDDGYREWFETNWPADLAGPLKEEKTDGYFKHLPGEVPQERELAGEETETGNQPRHDGNDGDRLEARPLF